MQGTDNHKLQISLRNLVIAWLVMPISCMLFYFAGNFLVKGAAFLWVKLASASTLTFVLIGILYLVACIAVFIYLLPLFWISKSIELSQSIFPSKRGKRYVLCGVALAVISALIICMVANSPGTQNPVVTYVGHGYMIFFSAMLSYLGPQAVREARRKARELRLAKENAQDTSAKSVSD